MSIAPILAHHILNSAKSKAQPARPRRKDRQEHYPVLGYRDDGSVLYADNVVYLTIREPRCR